MSLIRIIGQLVLYAPELIKIFFQISKLLKDSKKQAVLKEIKEAKTDAEKQAALDRLNKLL